MECIFIYQCSYRRAVGRFIAWKTGALCIYWRMYTTARFLLLPTSRLNNLCDIFKSPLCKPACANYNRINSYLLGHAKLFYNLTELCSAINNILHIHLRSPTWSLVVRPFWTKTGTRIIRVLINGRKQSYIFGKPSIILWFLTLIISYTNN